MTPIQVSSGHINIRLSPDTASAANILGQTDGVITVDRAVRLGDFWRFSVCIHTDYATAIEPPKPAPPPPTPEQVMTTPYISQWASTASNRGSDCGQTCVAMLATLQGWEGTVNELTYQNSPNGLSDAYDLVNNFELICGLPAEVRTLAAYEPTPPGAICLIDYSAFPVGVGAGYKQDGYAGLHWVVLLKEVPGKYVEVHDPDFYGDRIEEGSHKKYSWEDWIVADYGQAARTIVVLT